MKNGKYSGTKKVTITGNEEIAQGVFLLSFDRKFEFIPGQVVAISAEIDFPAPRLYSICSGSQESQMSILFNVVPGGTLTSQLAGMRKGEKIFCSSPFGSFTCDGRKAWYIASGTGIAPFISMIRSGITSAKTLIHGGRSLDSFYFRDELKDFFGENYIRCCSSGKGDGVFEGRLTAYLSAQDALPYDNRYYLCGSAEMVVETRDILISKGIPYDMIAAEIYF